MRTDVTMATKTTATKTKDGPVIVIAKPRDIREPIKPNFTFYRDEGPYFGHGTAYEWHDEKLDAYEYRDRNGHRYRRVPWRRRRLRIHAPTGN